MVWKLFVLSLAVFGHSAAFVIRSPRESDNNYVYEEYQCPTAAFLGEIFGELSNTFNEMAYRLERSPQMYNNHRSLRGHHGHRRGYGYHHLPPPPPMSPFAPRPYLQQQQYNGVPFAVSPWHPFPHRNPFLKVPGFPNAPLFSKPPGFPQGPQVSDFSKAFPHFAKNSNNNWNNSSGDFGIGPGKPITSQLPLQPQPRAKTRQNLQSQLQPPPQHQFQPLTQLQPQPQLQSQQQPQPQLYPQAQGQSQPQQQPQLQLQREPQPQPEPQSQPQPQPQPQSKSQQEINDLLLEIFSPQGSSKNFPSNTESPEDDLIQSVLGPSEKMETVSKEDSGQSTEDIYPTFSPPGESQKLDDWIQSVLLRDKGDIEQPTGDISSTFSPLDNSDEFYNWEHPKMDTSDQSRMEDYDIR